MHKHLSKILLTGILVFVFVNLKAQSETGLYQKFKIHKITLKTMDGHRMVGFLESFDSTGVTIADKIPDKATKREFVPAENIKSMKLRRRGSVLRGTAYGMTIGFAIGALGSSASAEDGWLMSRENKIVAGGILTGILGGGIGAFTGSSYKSFEINGKIPMYHLKIPILNEMVYRVKTSN